VKFSVQLVKCGRCGKPRGLTHTCLSQRRAPAQAKLAPKARVTSKCGTCHKTMTNPLTHVCVTKRSAPKRAAPKKAPAKKPPRVKVVRPAGPKKAAHSHSACKDEACQRQACVGYRDGYADGFEDGRAVAQ
jgi:hypothetical protein